MDMVTVMRSSIVQGAITGAIAAAGVDIHAFQTWKSFNDVATYSWSTALFRWLQGAVLGAVAGVGFTGLA